MSSLRSPALGLAISAPPALFNSGIVIMAGFESLLELSLCLFFWPNLTACVRLRHDLGQRKPQTASPLRTTIRLRPLRPRALPARLGHDQAQLGRGKWRIPGLHSRNPGDGDVHSTIFVGDMNRQNASSRREA